MSSRLSLSSSDESDSDICVKPRKLKRRSRGINYSSSSNDSNNVDRILNKSAFKKKPFMSNTLNETSDEDLIPSKLEKTSLNMPLLDTQPDVTDKRMTEKATNSEKKSRGRSRYKKSKQKSVSTQTMVIITQNMSTQTEKPNMQNMATQTEETSYNKCKFCKKTFTYEHELNNHEQTHHPCPNPNCKKVFSRADNLKRHMKNSCFPKDKAQKTTPKPILPHPTTTQPIMQTNLKDFIENFDLELL